MQVWWVTSDPSVQASQSSQMNLEGGEEDEKPLFLSKPDMTRRSAVGAWMPEVCTALQVVISSVLTHVDPQDTYTDGIYTFLGLFSNPHWKNNHTDLHRDTLE